MAVSVFKTFSAGEILTASDLNSSFSQIVDNGEDLGWPSSQAKDMNGTELILDADADSSITADTDDQIDYRLGGNDLMRMLVTSSHGEFKIISAVADANVGPFLVLDRNSASPADSDYIGQIIFRGRDDGANSTDYASIKCQIADTTDATEDARLFIDMLRNGATETVAQFGSGPSMTLKSIDTTATSNPLLHLYRNSASPAAADIMGQILFDGTDSAGNTTSYATIEAEIVDPTDSTEDGQLNFKTFIAGTDTKIASLGSGPVLTLFSTDAGATVNPLLRLFRNSASPADNDILGALYFDGNDDAGTPTQTTYASVIGKILDFTDGTEDGQLNINAMVAGTDTEIATVNSAGITLSSASANFIDQAGTLHPVYQPAKQATTSGTTVNFASIPSYVRKIDVMLDSVSTNSSSLLMIQLGTGGAPTATGYVTCVVRPDDATESTNTAGFSLIAANTAATATQGMISFTSIDSAGTTWTGNGNFASGGKANVCGGSVTLAGRLDYIRLTSVSADTFDAGSVGILGIG